MVNEDLVTRIHPRGSKDTSAESQLTRSKILKLLNSLIQAFRVDLHKMRARAFEANG